MAAAVISRPPRIYLNEIDPFAIRWLKQLMAAREIPMADLDTRPIQEIKPADLRGYDQCHFFAGIGGWPLALAMAHWPTNERVWTGSCPCQPFSNAGKRKGTKDERHLWPVWRRLLRGYREQVGEVSAVFGEQVASQDGLLWLAGVHTDLVDDDFVFGASDLCAAGVGAPHIRQRLWWSAYGGLGVADPAGRFARIAAGPAVGQGRPLVTTGDTSRVADSGHRDEYGRLKLAGAPGDGEKEESERQWLWPDVGAGRDIGGMADSLHAERGSQCRSVEDEQHGRDVGWPQARGDLGARGALRRMGESEEQQWEWDRQTGGGLGRSSNHGPSFSAWDDYIILQCTDGKARRTESSIFPLASGVPNRVGKLRGYGNAIVPQEAAEFILASREAIVDFRAQ